MLNRKINYAILIAAASLIVLAGCGNDSQAGQPSDLGVSASTAAADIITLDEAKFAALSHAGLSESDVVFVKTKLDRDSGMDEYDIEFTAEDFKYEYEVDAVSGRILEFSSEMILENRTETGASSDDASEQITLDEAKAIALKHAGVSESAAVFTEARLDDDNGIAEYDIEFTAGNAEYEYEIDAVSGNIVSDKVKYNYEAVASSVKVTESSAQTPAQISAQTAVQTTAAALGQITLDEAKAIALKHASVDESAAVFTKAKLDYDDGIAEYEIEFIANDIEYEYEISADSGSVLKNSAEKIKHTTSAVASEQITIDEAKTIALEHSGFTADQVKFTKSKLDYDDGMAEYEIEFKTNGFEYEYKINASTGQIIEFDIDDD